jgi:hypothetical protein
MATYFSFGWKNGSGAWVHVGQAPDALLLEGGIYCHEAWACIPESRSGSSRLETGDLLLRRRRPRLEGGNPVSRGGRSAASKTHHGIKTTTPVKQQKQKTGTKGQQQTSKNNTPYFYDNLSKI